MYYLESRSRGISYMKYVSGRQTGLVTIKEKIQGRIEMTGRQGRRRRKLLDNLKERRG
jgi:hypothetical protein